MISTLLLAVLAVPHTLAGLVPRQLPDVPAACRPLCDPVNVLLTRGCRAEVCCSIAFAQSYFNCWTCFGQNNGITNYTVPQRFIDSQMQQCALNGFALPRFTFPDQDPNRSVSIPAPTGSVSRLTTVTSAGSLSASSTPTPSPPTLTTPAGPQATVGPSDTPSVSVSVLPASPTPSGGAGDGNARQAFLMPLLAAFLWALFGV